MRTGFDLNATAAETIIPVSMTLDKILKEVIRLADKNCSQSDRSVIQAGDLIASLKCVATSDFLDTLPLPNTIDVELVTETEEANGETNEQQIAETEEDEQFCWPSDQKQEQDNELFALWQTQYNFDEDVKEMPENQLRSAFKKIIQHIENLHSADSAQANQ